MVTVRQVELVQDSFALVLPLTARAAADFYARLFALAPETRALFGGDMDEQGRKLFQTLAMVVDSLHRIERILPVAHALAVRHVGYGVRDEHYAVVGTALLGTLRDALGARFDPDTEAAWAAAYAMLADQMMAAARAAGSRAA